MGIDVIGGATASGALPKFAFTLASNRAVVRQNFAAGIYVFTVPSGTYNVAFYAANGDLVKQTSYMSAVTTIAFSLPSTATELIVSSSVNGGATADYTPEATTLTSLLVTTTQSVTLAKPAKVFLIGGGAAGSYGPGGSSGYFAHGTVAAGTYTATVGAAGVGNAGQAGSASTFGSLTANGGTVAAGGSGGGTAGNNSGLPGGGGASNGGSANGTGSGVELHGFVPGPGGAGGNAGQGGGTYAGGGGGKPSYSGSPAYGYGGGGGGAENGGASGSNGAILIIEDF